MEPGLYEYALTQFLIFGVPAVFFFIGVVVSVLLNLNDGLKGSVVFLMSLLIAPIVLGITIGASAVDVPGALESSRQYGHMDSVTQYLTFCGMIGLYGTVVPQLFDTKRNALKAKVGKGEEGVRSDEPAPPPQ